jgi:hypothetical protein
VVYHTDVQSIVGKSLRLVMTQWVRHLATSLLKSSNDKIFSWSRFQRLSCPLAFFYIPGLVHSATAEMPFSVLRRLKTYIRSTMKNDRLSSLGLMHILTEMLKWTCTKQWRCSYLLRHEGQILDCGNRRHSSTFALVNSAIF